MSVRRASRAVAVCGVLLAGALAALLGVSTHDSLLAETEPISLELHESSSLVVSAAFASPTTPTLPVPNDLAANVEMTQTLAWSGTDPDGERVTYTVAFGTDPSPPVVAQTNSWDCNSSGGSGGLAAGIHDTTVAGQPAVVIVGKNYDPAKPAYLAFWLHGDDGTYKVFSASVAQMIDEKGWVFVSPQATARDSDGAHSWWSKPDQHITLFTNVLEEIYSKYNLCRNALFGAGASGGSIFYGREWFPRKGGDYPAYMMLTCGAGNLRDDDNWDLDEKARGLGKDAEVNARSLFHFTYGPNDFLFSQIQTTIDFYRSAGFRVIDEQLAGEGHCTWNGFPMVADFWSTNAPIAPRYRYAPGALQKETKYYWQITASDGQSQQVGPIWSFNTGSVNNVYMPFVIHANGNSPPPVGGKPPELVAVAPPAAQVGVTQTTGLTGTYNQLMNGGTVSPGTFVVHGNQSGLAAGAYSAEGTQVQLQPNKPFHPGELVQASLTTGTQDITGTAPLTPFVWAFRTAAVGGNGTFNGTGQELGIAWGNSVAIGDLDGDMDLDLVFVGSRRENVNSNLVYFNDGSGSFTAGAFFDDAERAYSSAALADMDHDGDLDLVVSARLLGSNDTVFWNSGTGTFPTQKMLGFSDQSAKLALGDLNGDGLLDVVVGRTLRKSVIYLNLGGGSFAPAVDLATVADATSAVAVADLNSDGALDIVVGNQKFGNDPSPDVAGNAVYFNASDGTFPTMGTFGPGNDDTRTIAVGDADGDGDVDVLIGNMLAQDVLYLNAGDGTFPLSRPVGAADSRTVSLALGDVDGDNDLDVIRGDDRAGDEVFVNDGGANFTLAGSFSPGNAFCSDGSGAVGLGDLDRDGDLDVAIANNNALCPNSVLLNGDAVAE